MKIQELRRIKLKEWLAGKPLPEKERSLFSRLLNAKLTFGERVARRLEITYGMDHMYLDTPTPGIVLDDNKLETNDSNPRKEKKNLSLDRIEFVKELLNMSNDKLEFIRELVNMPEDDFKTTVTLFHAANVLAKEVKKPRN